VGVPSLDHVDAAVAGRFVQRATVLHSARSRTGASRNGRTQAAPRAQKAALLSMTTIRADTSSIADALLQVLTAATEDVMCRQPGFISANCASALIDSGSSITRIGDPTGDFEAMQSNREVAANMKRAAPIAERFDPVLSAVAYVDDNPDVA